MMLSEFLLNTYRLENMFLISKCFCTLSQKMFSSCYDYGKKILLATVNSDYSWIALAIIAMKFANT